MYEEIVGPRFFVDNQKGELMSNTATTIRSLKEIEKCLLKGDSLSTAELKRAKKHYGRLRDNLGELGHHWHFAFTEANRLWMLSRDYLNARKSSF